MPLPSFKDQFAALIAAPVTGSRDVQDDGLSFALSWNHRF